MIAAVACPLAAPLTARRSVARRNALQARQAPRARVASVRTQAMLGGGGDDDKPKLTRASEPKVR